MDGAGSGAVVFVAVGGTAAASFSAPKASEAVISTAHKPDSTGLLLFIGPTPVVKNFSLSSGEQPAAGWHGLVLWLSYADQQIPFAVKQGRVSL
jgi:hypothetical protein